MLPTKAGVGRKRPCRFSRGPMCAKTASGSKCGRLRNDNTIPPLNLNRPEINANPTTVPVTRITNATE